MAIKFYPQVDRRVVQYRLDTYFTAGVTLEKGNELYALELAIIDPGTGLVQKVVLAQQQAVVAYEFLRQLLRGQERNVVGYEVREYDMGNGHDPVPHDHEPVEDDVLEDDPPDGPVFRYEELVERVRQLDDRTCPVCGKVDCKNVVCALYEAQMLRRGERNAKEGEGKG